MNPYLRTLFQNLFSAEARIAEADKARREVQALPDWEKAKDNIETTIALKCDEETQEKAEASKTFSGTTGMTAYIDAAQVEQHGLEAGLTSLARQILNQSQGHRVEGHGYIGINISGIEFSYILDTE